VADFHRSLLEGGVFFYPADRKRRSGKLRLLYECAPLAFVVEQAGGAASTGTRRILDVRAETIHQRVPLVIGSAEDVARYERLAREP
jgi:fructose-1,6-bisphosphatase I